PGDRSSATARITMSRSVIIPTRRSFSPTGKAPILSVRMRRAASRIVMLGSAMCTVGVMILLTCMAVLLRQREGYAGLTLVVATCCLQADISLGLAPRLQGGGSR